MLTSQEESILIQLMIELSEKYFEVSNALVRRYAYFLASKKNFLNEHIFSKKTLGKDWYYNFLKRNSDFRLKKLQMKSTRETFKQKIRSIVNLESILKNNVYVVSSALKIDMSNIFQDTDDNIMQIFCCANMENQHLKPLVVLPKKIQFILKASDLAVYHNIKIIYDLRKYENSDFDILIEWVNHFVDEINSESPTMLLLHGCKQYFHSFDVLALLKTEKLYYFFIPEYLQLEINPLENFLKNIQSNLETQVLLNPTDVNPNVFIE